MLSITEGSVPGPYPLLDSRLFREEGGVRAAATPIQPGMIDIAVTVYIDYLVS